MLSKLVQAGLEQAWTFINFLNKFVIKLKIKKKKLKLVMIIQYIID